MFFIALKVRQDAGNDNKEQSEIDTISFIATQEELQDLLIKVKRDGGVLHVCFTVMLVLLLVVGGVCSIDYYLLHIYI